MDTFKTHTEYGKKDDSYIEAFSGKDGHLLWRSEMARHDGSPDVGNRLILQCLKLEGKDHPDVLCSVNNKERTRWPDELVLLDGRNGKVLWRQKWPDKSTDLGPLFKGGAVDWPELTCNAFTAKVNGEDAVVVVVPHDRWREDSNGWVFSGRTGKPIQGPLQPLPDDKRLIPNNTADGLRFHVQRGKETTRDGKRLPIKDSVTWTKSEEVVWRCDGPGECSGTWPPLGEGKPPAALFIVETSGRPYTVCLEALPVGSTPPVLDFGTGGTDPFLVELPWATLGKQRISTAAWTGLISLGVVVFYAIRRRRAALWLSAWLLGFPVFVGMLLIPHWPSMPGHEKSVWNGLSEYLGWYALFGPISACAVLFAGVLLQDRNRRQFAAWLIGGQLLLVTLLILGFYRLFVEKAKDDWVIVVWCSLFFLTLGVGIPTYFFWLLFLYLPAPKLSRSATTLLLGIPMLLIIVAFLTVSYQKATIEPFDWSGWYLLWPYSFSALEGWTCIANPLTWVGLWLVWRTIVHLWPHVRKWYEWYNSPV